MYPHTSFLFAGDPPLDPSLRSYKPLTSYIDSGNTNGFIRNFFCIKKNVDHLKNTRFTMEYINDEQHALFLTALGLGRFEICKFLISQQVNILCGRHSVTEIVYCIEDAEILQFCLEIYDKHLKPIEKAIINYKINHHEPKRQKPSWDEYDLQQRRVLFITYGLIDLFEQSIKPEEVFDYLNMSLANGKYTRGDIEITPNPNYKPDNNKKPVLATQQPMIIKRLPFHAPSILYLLSMTRAGNQFLADHIDLLIVGNKNHLDSRPQWTGNSISLGGRLITFQNNISVKPPAKDIDKKSLENFYLNSARYNLTKFVEFALAAGVNKDVIDRYGNSALLFASIRGHTATVTLLSKDGANPNQINKDGNSALLLATREGHTATVEILLKAGANPNQINTITKYDTHPTTPLEAALKVVSADKRLKIVRLLLAHKANPNGADTSRNVLNMTLAKRLYKTFDVLIDAGGKCSSSTLNTALRNFDLLLITHLVLVYHVESDEHTLQIINEHRNSHAHQKRMNPIIKFLIEYELIPPQPDITMVSSPNELAFPSLKR